MINRVLCLNILLFLTACFNATDYTDVSGLEEYSSLLGLTFITKAGMVVQSFEEVVSTKNIAEGKEVEVARLWVGGLKNRHLKWTREAPVGTKFSIARVIKTELAGGFTLYYQVKFENLEGLEDIVTIVRVPDSRKISENAGLLASDFELVK